MTSHFINDNRGAHLRKCLQLSRGLVGFSQEIIRIVRIDIVGMCPRRTVQRPAHRAFGEEEQRTVATIEGHFFEVIGWAIVRLEIKGFGLNTPAIAIKPYSRRGRKTHLCKLGRCQLINSLVRHTDFHPSAGSQHRRCPPTLRRRADKRATGRRNSLNNEFERRQTGRTSIVNDERQNSHIELTLLLNRALMCRHLQRVGQLNAPRFEFFHFGRRKRGELRIINPHLASRRQISRSQRNDGRIIRQDAIHRIVRRPQVNKAVGPCRQRKEQQPHQPTASGQKEREVHSLHFILLLS